MDHRRILIAKTTLKKKNKAGGITLPHLKIYFKPTVIKTVWYWHKDRHTNQCNRISINLELYPCIYGQLIFKDAKNTQWGKRSLFSKGCWENWISTCKIMKLDAYLMPYTKINSKWSKDLNIRPEIVSLEENIGKKLHDIGLGSDFMVKTPKAQAMKTSGNTSS